MIGIGQEKCTSITKEKNGSKGQCGEWYVYLNLGMRIYGRFDSVPRNKGRLNKKIIILI